MSGDDYNMAKAIGVSVIVIEDDHLSDDNGRSHDESQIDYENQVLAISTSLALMPSVALAFDQMAAPEINGGT